ncbi:response regulator receiver domain-containing protein [Haloarcula quadrata]|uniref:Response regulator receiver domain-containing protein n=1 Tax=Haloarcula quadrata TaxID=182779 RepID=A0A495R7Q9_9EURY|nr:response regulator receiver domain-containing protein [Haloarcula quadrata]
MAVPVIVVVMATVRYLSTLFYLVYRPNIRIDNIARDVFANVTQRLHMSHSVQEGIQVLHVDDELDFPALTNEFLEREEEQFEVVAATDASEALDIIHKSKPDCIVSDFDMPGMDGTEFLQIVRVKYPELPFIFFSSHDSETVMGDAVAVGATDYVEKEATSEQYELLADRVRSAVQNTP